MALTRPFAQNGEKSPIPQVSQDGTVSYDQGFGILYTLTPEEGGKYIDREQFNQILYDTTSAVIENQNSIDTLNDKIADIENAGVVNLTGNQTINGIKTFRSPVVIPNGTAINHAVNLGQLNTKANTDATVNLTTNQNIQGVKTFLSPPVSATNPTANNQVANKAYVDGRTSRYITQTYSSGSSWYRVWSDRWCEQGATIDTTNTTVTFLQPFRDTNYTLVGVGFGIRNVGRQSVIKYADKFVTSSNISRSNTESWYACGYIA